MDWSIRRVDKPETYLGGKFHFLKGFMGNLLDRASQQKVVLFTEVRQEILREVIDARV